MKKFLCLTPGILEYYQADKPTLARGQAIIKNKRTVISGI
jgi:hypothetical protein